MSHNETCECGHSKAEHAVSPATRSWCAIPVCLCAEFRPEPDHRPYAWEQRDREVDQEWERQQCRREENRERRRKP
jgi:hypothetical protein